MSRTARLTVLLLILSACHREAKDPNLLVASGHVEATDVRISTKIGGRLQTFGLQEGDAVQPGKEIARIDTTDIGLALQQELAERGQAAAELALRVAGPSKEEIGQAAAQVEQAQADLEGSQKDLDRMQGLLDSGSGTTKSRDDAKTRRDVASARVTGSCRGGSAISRSVSPSTATSRWTRTSRSSLPSMASRGGRSGAPSCSTCCA